MKTDISKDRLDMELDVPSTVQQRKEDSQERCMHEV